MSDQTEDTGPLPRFCRETRSQLPAWVKGELAGWPERIVSGHLRHCVDCAAELERQRGVESSIDALRTAEPDPPPELLATLLDQAASPGLRERVAVPTRGAISGARPGLSVAYLSVGAAASTGIGWALWKGIRRLRQR